jgi:hypothetical protein
MPKGPKHHYIPAFYLKQWARDKGRLCEFSKPHDRVKPRKTYPEGTAYVHGLNTVEGLPPAETHFLEEVFFQIADDTAARALRILLTPPPWTLTPKERSGWSRFIMSLLVRNPESMQRYKEVAAAIFREALPRIEATYAKEHGPGDPPTYAEYAQLHGPNPAARTIVRVVQKLADNEELGRRINSMRWTVLSDPDPKFELLTSDRPMLMTNGIGPPRGHLIMPISPSHIFVATNNVETENHVRTVWKNRDAIAQVNDRVASQARKYVYSADDRPLAFVSNRLGLGHTADPLENLSFDALLAAARAAASAVSSS